MDAAIVPHTEWVHFGELPAECPVDIAQNPERVLIDLGWEDCGEGCQRWTGTARLRWRGNAEPGRTWVQANSEEGQIVALLDLDLNRVVVAFRYVSESAPGIPRCYVDAVADDRDIGVIAQLFQYDLRGERVTRSWARFYRGRTAEASSSALQAVVDDMPLLVQTLRISRTRMAAEAEGAIAFGADPILTADSMEFATLRCVDAA